MEILIITLLCVAIFLLLLSFFKKDSLTNLERTVDELSLQHVQDLYQLKNRVRILEEELLSVNTFDVLKKEKAQESSNSNEKINKILENQVLALDQQGMSIEEISKRSTLTHQDIRSILKESKTKGSLK